MKRGLSMKHLLLSSLILFASVSAVAYNKADMNTQQELPPRETLESDVTVAETDGSMVSPGTGYCAKCSGNAARDARTDGSQSSGTSAKSQSKDN